MFAMIFIVIYVGPWYLYTSHIYVGVLYLVPVTQYTCFFSCLLKCKQVAVCFMVFGCSAGWVCRLRREEESICVYLDLSLRDPYRDPGCMLHILGVCVFVLSPPRPTPTPHPYSKPYPYP